MLRSVLLCWLVSTATWAWAETDSSGTRPVTVNDGQPIKIIIPDNADPQTTERLWKLISAVYAAEGLSVQKVSAPLARIYLMAENGQVDAVLGGLPDSVEPQYPQLVRLPTAILSTAYHIYALPDFAYNGPASLQGQRIVAMRGSESIKRLLPNTEIQWVNESLQLVKLLELRRADVAIGLERQMTALLAEMPDSPVTRMDASPFYSFSLYHYLNIRHKNLAPGLDARLQHLLAQQAAPKKKGTPGVPFSTE